ncbi:MAG: SufD family Fe-S cluster assembly protein [Actinomycetota bacterium]|nr:SufD family Fe-S cluster assembly protein [Actinomycetota bacterium]
MNKKIIEKNIQNKASKDFEDISVKNEDWKYVGKNVFNINNFEIGKESKLSSNEEFNLDSNCYNHSVNDDIEGVSVTNLIDITSPIVDESIKRPLDKFVLEQFEKVTGGFRLDLDKDFSEYYSINYQSDDTAVPYLGINVNTNTSGKVFLNFAELVKGNTYPLIELFLDKNASLELIISATSDSDIQLINTLYGKLLNDASLSIHLVSTGASFSRSRMDIDLVGNGSRFNIDGVYFGEENQVHDNRVFVNHLGKNTSSNMITKGVLGDESSSIFTGTIHIGEGAEKTDSHQQNRNILLSEKATAQSVPNLEILCDDVICSHGSSVGPIDEKLYHYVMSRGIDKESAEKLLIKGFFNEVINDESWEIIHDQVSNILEKKYENVLERANNGKS